MSVNFEILRAVQRLEPYFARHYSALQRQVYDSSSQSDASVLPVGEYNMLVSTLNDLFAGLTNSDDRLFKEFEQLEPSAASDECEDDDVDVSVGTQEDDEPSAGMVGLMTAGLCSLPAHVGQEMYEHMDSSKEKARKMLDEYKETAVRDVATYLPEDDAPVEVSNLYKPIDEAVPAGLVDLPYSYLNHTVDNEPIDKNPHQIAGVMTAVEREGVHAYESMNLNVSDYRMEMPATDVVDAIADDIAALMVSPASFAAYDAADDEPVQTDSDAADDEPAAGNSFDHLDYENMDVL